MIIFRTHPEHIPRVVELSVHALSNSPNIARGDMILISKTLGQDKDPVPPIRYVMEFVKIRPDRTGELSRAIWGAPWPYIVHGKDCRPLKQPFDIRDIQVSSKNYGQGGTVVHVAPEDEALIRQLGLVD